MPVKDEATEEMALTVELLERDATFFATSSSLDESSVTDIWVVDTVT